MASIVYWSPSAEARLWNECFESCKLVMTPGADCRHDQPGCYRMCFAAVARAALPVAVARLAALLHGPRWARHSASHTE